MVHFNREQINVFISSAQRNENGLAWNDIRREIKDKLSGCPYINAFIIEDSTSELPSSQFFSYKVERSDIVVLLVKGELRAGTSAEYAIAKKNKKPFLVYFIQDDQPDINVTQLKKEIENNDYCTYCGNLNTTDHIGEKVLNDLINNIITYYQFNHHTGITNADTLEFSTATDTDDANSLIPNKMALSYFSSSYNHLFERMGYGYLKPDKQNELSIFHDLGIKIIDWLIDGYPFYKDEGITKLVMKMKEFYPQIEWLAKRHEAIAKYFNAEFEAALKLEEDALNIARVENLPEWIINDILIDCRNFENAVNSKQKKYSYGEYQQELDKLTSFIYLPVSDRFLEEAYRETIREEIKLKTQSPNTITFGTNIAQIINYIENYLFSSILYGSCIHIIISRISLAQILFKYGEFSADNYMIYQSLSLFLLSGESKTYKQVLLDNWDNIHSAIIANASKTWQLTNMINPLSKDASKQLFLAHLGLYLSDDEFAEAENYLLNFADHVTWDNSSGYFDCIRALSCRLNQEKVVEKIIQIIRDKRFNLGSDITGVLFNIKISDISPVILEKLRDELQIAMKQIISRNGDPQFIAYLVLENPDIFLPLKENPDNGISGIQKIYYELNSGVGSWEKALRTAIANVYTQYEANKNRGSYTSFATNPFDIIANIMDRYYSKDFEDIISKDLFPICIKILLSKTNTPLKDDCLKALCSIVSQFIKNDISLPRELFDAVVQCDISQDGDIPLFNNSNRETLSLRLTILKLFLNLEQHDVLFDWCLEYQKKEICERTVLADCIVRLLEKSKDISNDLDMIISSIIFQMADDDYFIIRMKAIKCLTLIMNSKYEEKVKQKLCGLAVDASPAVRTKLLRQCNKKTFHDKSFSRIINDTLSKDANFGVRKEAAEIIKSFS